MENCKWGNKFIESLSKDIKISFPDITGFSVRNLKYMKKFAQIDPQFVQGVLAQIPWYSNIAIMDKIDTEDKKEMTKPMGISEYQLQQYLPALTDIENRINLATED